MLRRKFLFQLGAGTMLSLSPFSTIAARIREWEKVMPADLSRLSPDDFRDHELDLPYYLAHFHVLANGVKMEGKNKGFIEIPIWRNERDNEPYNARIMENILSMVFFYTTKSQRDHAISRLPYIKYNAFIHQRMDNRIPAVHTFIKRPGYYLIFNSGQLVDDRQRYGVGLVWHPKGGTIIQSQTATNNAAWGTMGADHLYEARDLAANFLIDGRKVEPEPGVKNLQNGSLEIQYSLEENGNKNLKFDQYAFTVDIEHPGAFREYLPFIVRNRDNFERENNKIVLYRNGEIIEIRHPVGMDIVSHTRNIPGEDDYHLTVFVLSGVDQLTYEFSFPG